jgi:hypothetical protein
MKKIALGLALCLAAACASEKKSSMSDPSAPTATKAECCDKAGDKACCDKNKADCQKTCPVTGQKVQG